MMVNVNLRRCDCGAMFYPAMPHAKTCAGALVLIPCRVPESFVCEVVLGDGACLGFPTCTVFKTNTDPTVRGIHASHCPARPVRASCMISCAISGRAWEKSEVADAWPEKNDGYLCSSGDSFPALEHIARERWALVKALVTGDGANGRWKPDGPMGWAVWDKPGELFAQRDVVYAALAEQARLEESMLAAQQRTVRAIGSPRLTTGAVQPEDRPSAQALAVYVEELIETVGALR